jgi:hypothetical protein
MCSKPAWPAVFGDFTCFGPSPRWFVVGFTRGLRADRLAKLRARYLEAVANHDPNQRVVEEQLQSRHAREDVPAGDCSRSPGPTGCRTGATPSLVVPPTSPAVLWTTRYWRITTVLSRSDRGADKKWGRQ